MTASNSQTNGQEIWQLTDHRATLADLQLQAQLDLQDPLTGLLVSKVQSSAAANIRPLSIALPDSASLASSLSETYVRERDLVAVYEESNDRPFRTQVYWNAIEAGMQGQLLGGVELIVSVNTSGLDVDSEYLINTEFPAGELLRLRDADTKAFETEPADSPQTTEFNQAEGPGVFLFRPADADWSYAEIVHAADFSAATLSPTETAGIRRLTHQLFHRQMEKGVIVRSRMRGVFLSRDGDEAAAVGCFEDLRHAKLPLTV